jgi:hemerythrin superfamily protein
MNVLTLLKKDHRTVEGLLDRAVKCEPGDGTLDDLAGEIEDALTVHATIEEKYFYPLLRERSEQPEDVVDVYEAFTEHDLVKRLVALLQSGRQPDEQFKAEVQVLAENVKHHVKEEESTIFGLAKDVLDDDELEELGEKMAEAKMRLTAAETNGAARGGATRKRPARKTVARTASVRR